MRPHPRIRKTVKWGGAVVSLLLLVAWALSGWCAVDLGMIHRLSGEICGGVILVRIEGSSSGRWRPPSAPSRRISSEGYAKPRPMHWAFSAGAWANPDTGTVETREVAIPLWFPILIAMTVTIFIWRLDTLARRRAKLGACPKCFYSRAGLAPSAVCPECGSPAPVRS